MIYCVWYPSGGFGHFVNAVLSVHGNNFDRPANKLVFSEVGDSHSLDLIVPKYTKNQWPGGRQFDRNKNYSVLIDNGINDENTDFKTVFENSIVIKICYSDLTWPIVARTMIDKAMRSSIDKELTMQSWSSREPWAMREKYFLYLRDHALRHAWKPDNDCALFIDHMLHYQRFYQQLNSWVGIDNFESTWHQWRAANAKYIDPVEHANSVLIKLKQNCSTDLTHITDIWSQAVLYYYIWLEYQIEVPHNDFANFFSSTKQILNLIA